MDPLCRWVNDFHGHGHGVLSPGVAEEWNRRNPMKKMHSGLVKNMSLFWGGNVETTTTENADVEGFSCVLLYVL